MLILRSEGDADAVQRVRQLGSSSKVIVMLV